ncbi:MAG: methyltransferase, partial [Rickettsiales bacterium]|nr:methyltransferase [Rickettsiales bacterium]
TGDALLLASAIDGHIVRRGTRILDVGIGGGAVALSILERFKEASATGIDVQDDMLDLAERSSALNGAGTRLVLMNEDILKPSAKFRRMEFDIVVTNPPYHEGRASPDASRARARSADAGISEWVGACIKRLRSSGTFAIVHKAEKIDEVISAIKENRMGRVEIFPFYTKRTLKANRIVARAVKDSRAPASIHPPIVLHDDGGGFSAVARRIFEQGEAIATILEEFI